MEDELKRLEKIFGKVSDVSSNFDVYATAKIYPKLVKVFIPNSPIHKKIPFMEEHEGDNDWSNTATSSAKTSNEDNLERSLRKTKTLIADYVLCNDFELFATFTFSPERTRDRFNPDLVKLQMANWLKNQRSRNGRFEYLIVPEFHKDRRALHFHGLFANYNGDLIPAGKTSKGRELFHFKSYTLGFNSAVKIDNPERVSSYVRKYITKDMPQFRGQHRFWSSKELKKPRVVDNPTDLKAFGTPVREYKNDYGITIYFQRSEESEEEVLAS